MSLVVGVQLITLASMLLTWLMFGRSVDGSRKGRFFYWLKSTLFSSVALMLWVLYKEPDIDLVMVAGFSFVFSAVANLLRSQWSFSFL